MSQRNVGKEKYARALFVFAFTMGIMILQAPKAQANNTLVLRNISNPPTPGCQGLGTDLPANYMYDYIRMTSGLADGGFTIGQILSNVHYHGDPANGPGEVVRLEQENQAPQMDIYCIRLPVGNGNSQPPAPPASPTLEISVDPSNIQAGQSTRVTSTVTNATSCWGWQIVGGVAGEGRWFNPKGESSNFYPTKTTTYAMECWNAATPPVSTQVKAYTVNVSGAELSVGADKTSIESGATVTLSWTPRNATKCYSWTSVNTSPLAMDASNGTHYYTTPPIAATTTYSALCYDASDNDTGIKSVTITVNGNSGNGGSGGSGGSGGGGGTTPPPPSSCTPNWQPDPGNKCPSETVTQTDGCGNTRQVAGTNTNCGVSVMRNFMVCPRRPSIHAGEQVQFTAYWGVNVTRFPDDITCADPAAYNYYPTNEARWAWDRSYMKYHTITNNGLATGIAPGEESVDVWEQYNGQRFDDNGVWITVLPQAVSTGASNPIPTPSDTVATSIGTSVLLSWNATNAALCRLSGGGLDGDQPIKGSKTITVSGEATYVIECWNDKGVSSGKKAVAVIIPSS